MGPVCLLVPHKLTNPVLLSVSVWRALKETGHVSVRPTSGAPAVSTAPPPNMDQTVTEVSEGVTSHTSVTSCCSDLIPLPQPAPVSTDSVTTARTRTADVSPTRAKQDSPVSSVTDRRRPAASKLSSATPTQTVTSARESRRESAAVYQH